ncbi:DMP19 family protein [Roseateles chitinivorans]|uniref:DMP19 family protein n=1 Tax=Roseateles chitinivorans TaxID=2917965 RepID=UPI003D66543C
MKKGSVALAPSTMIRSALLTLAVLFGTTACKPTSEGAMSPELRQSLQESQRKAREAEARRPRVTSLSDDSWRAIPDDQLDEAVMAYIEGRIHGQNGEPTPLASLPHGFQIFHHSFIVEAEVANGGFNQFFWNSSGESAPQVPGALRALGAGEAAAMFEQVLQVADQDRPRLAAFKAQGSLQAFSASYKDSPLNAYDTPFMELAMKFSALRAEYLQRHADQFRE